MTQELISLEEINQLDKRALNLPIETFSLSRKNMLALLDTARAAHALKAEVERLERRDRNFAEQIKLTVTEEIAKARAEERERCAKIASSSGNHYCAAAIRALKD